MLAPLGMNDTKIVLTAAQWRTAVAPGRNSTTGQVAERNTPYGVLKGQGAFHSSVRDVAAFAAAALAVGRGNTTAMAGFPPRLRTAMAAALTPRAPNDYPAMAGEVASEA